MSSWNHGSRHLAHPTHTERGDDFERAAARAGRQRRGDKSGRCYRKRPGNSDNSCLVAMWRTGRSDYPAAALSWIWAGIDAFGALRCLTA